MNNGELNPNQNVPPGQPVLASRPTECSHGFAVQALVVGGILDFQHRRGTTILESDSLAITAGTETVFVDNPLQAGDEVWVRQSAPVVGGSGFTTPSPFRVFVVEDTDDESIGMELNLIAPGLCADIAVFTTVPTKVRLRVTRDDGTVALDTEIRSYVNRPSETGRNDPPFVAWEFARSNFGDNARVTAEATHCGSTASDLEFLRDSGSPAPPEIVDVVLFDTSRARVTYTRKSWGARVGFLLNGVETDWTYFPQFSPVVNEIVFWADAPGAASGDPVQLTQSFCTGGSPSPSFTLPPPIPDPAPQCGSLGVVLPDGPITPGTQEIRLAQAPPHGVTLHVFDGAGVKLGESTTSIVSVSRTLQAGDTLKFLLVGPTGCEADQVVVVELAPASCAPPALPSLAPGEFTIGEVDDFIIDDGSGNSPSRVQMPAFVDSNYPGSYQIDDPIVGRAAFPLMQGSIPAGVPVVVFVHGICTRTLTDFDSKDGYRVFQRLLALDGIASFSVALRNCGSRSGYGPWRAALLEQFLEFLERMPQTPGATPLPDDPFNGQFQGKLDLQRVMAVGHSTGFEGIAQYLVRKDRGGLHPSVNVQSVVGLGGWFLEPHVLTDPQATTEVAEWDIDRSDVLQALDPLPLLMLLGSQEGGFLSADLNGPPDVNAGNRGAALRWLLHRDRQAALSYVQLPDGRHEDWSSTWTDAGTSKAHQLGSAPLVRRWARTHLLGESQQWSTFNGVRRTMETGTYLEYSSFFSAAQPSVSDLFHRPPMSGGTTDSGGAITPAPGPQMSTDWSTLEYQDFASPPKWNVDSQPLVGVPDSDLANMSFGIGGWMVPSSATNLQVDATSSGGGDRTQALVKLTSGDYFALPTFEDSYLHPTSSTIYGQCLVDSGVNWAGGTFELTVPIEGDVIKLDRITSWP